MNYIIEKMQLNDIKTILDIQKLSYNDGWKEKDYIYELKENNFALYLIIKLKEQIIGFIGTHLIFEQAQITQFTINKQYQNKTYGSILINYLHEYIKDNGIEVISLEVRVSNIKAINFYKKHKYNIVATRRNYYPDNNEDAYLMIRGL